MRLAGLILCTVALVGCTTPDDPHVVSAKGDRIVLSWYPGPQKGEEAYARASAWCRESNRTALAGVEREGSRMRTREFFCDDVPVRTAESFNY
jgi:hypothetical protein